VEMFAGTVTTVSFLFASARLVIASLSFMKRFLKVRNVYKPRRNDIFGFHETYMYFKSLRA
jgi:hypothetical protein